MPKIRYFVSLRRRSRMQQACAMPPAPTVLHAQYDMSRVPHLLRGKRGEEWEREERQRQRQTQSSSSGNKRQHRSLFAPLLPLHSHSASTLTQCHSSRDRLFLAHDWSAVNRSLQSA